MSSRILMGLRGGVPGFFVSKPGIDVTTAGDGDLLMATHISNMQIVYSGVITFPPRFNTIAIPDQGFKPIIFYSCMKGIGTSGIQYLSNTSVILEAEISDGALNSWPTGFSGQVMPVSDPDLYFAVTNLPME